jgi:hypothetical protein
LDTALRSALALAGVAASAGANPESERAIDRVQSSRSGRPNMVERRRERSDDVLGTLRQERVEPHQLVTLCHVRIIQNGWIYGLRSTAINAIRSDVRKLKDAGYWHPIYKVKFVRPIMVIRVHMEQREVPVYFFEYLNEDRPKPLISDSFDAVNFNHDLLEFLKRRLAYSQKCAKFRALHIHFQNDTIAQNRVTRNVILDRE